MAVNRRFRLGFAGAATMVVAGMVLTAPARGQDGYGDLPPYAPPAGALAGASAARLWDEGQRLYRAGDHPGAAVVVRQAAMAGSGIATYEMGYFYEHGDGVPKSDAEAVRWYSRGAAKGNRESEWALGTYYERGGVMGPENFEAARRLYEQASKQGDFDASFNMARMYEFGLGVPLSLVEAAKWYSKAADQGNPDARERERKLINLYLEFDTDFPSAMERDLFFDEGARQVPTGRVFHSMEEHLAFERTQHGVNRNPAARQRLNALFEQTNNMLIARDAKKMAEYRRTHPTYPISQLSPSFLARIGALPGVPAR